MSDILLSCRGDKSSLNLFVTDLRCCASVADAPFF